MIYSTVGELKNRLADLSDDLPVLVSSDAEGNSIKGFYEGTIEHFIVDYYEAFLVADEDIDTEYDADEVKTALVIWPS